MAPTGPQPPNPPRQNYQAINTLVSRRARRPDRRPKFRSGIWLAEAMP